MSKESKAVSIDMERLAEDARALIAATANVAGGKVEEARKRLVTALEDGAEEGLDVCGDVYDRAMEGAKMADRTVREFPYQTIAVGVGVGLIIGLFVSRKCPCKHG